MYCRRTRNIHLVPFQNSNQDICKILLLLLPLLLLLLLLLSSTFAHQPTIFILFRSSSTWSIHLNLGLPAGLVLYDVRSVIFLVVLVFSILVTRAAHLSLCDFINFIISSCFILCLVICFNSPCSIWILHWPINLS